MVNVRTISGAVNTDQSGAAEARDFRSGSSASVGRQSPHVGGLGAGPQQTARSGSHRSSQYPQRSFGGQASGAGLFGIRLTADTGSAPKAAAVRPVQQASQARPVGDDQPRRIGGLSFGQRRAIVCGPSPAQVERRNAAMRAAALASDLRQEREWREYAELVETNPTLPYGSVETACALND